MARPIQNTPILKGEDAKRFRKNLIASLSRTLTVQEKANRRKELKEMKDSYHLLVSVSDGTFC